MQIGFQDMKNAVTTPHYFQKDVGFLFGPFTLLPSRRRLLSGNKNLPVGSRALDLLTLLVARTGEVLSKEKLISYTWPNTHVEEINLRVNMSALRKILGNGAGRDDYIVNVPGRGYCFVAPVTVTGDTTRDVNMWEGNN